jgi:hypothetical protein
MVFSSQHFRRKVVKSPAKGAPSRFRSNCPSEITYLHGVRRNQDILGLEVSVDDLFLVEIGYSLTNLSDDHSHRGLGEFACFFKDTKELSFGCILKDEDD